MNEDDHRQKQGFDMNSNGSSRDNWNTRYFGNDQTGRPSPSQSGQQNSGHFGNNQPNDTNRPEIRWQVENMNDASRSRRYVLWTIRRNSDDRGGDRDYPYRNESPDRGRQDYFREQSSYRENDGGYRGDERDNKYRNQSPVRGGQDYDMNLSSSWGTVGGHGGGYGRDERDYQYRNQSPVRGCQDSDREINSGWNRAPSSGHDGGGERDYQYRNKSSDRQCQNYDRGNNPGWNCAPSRGNEEEYRNGYSRGMDRENEPQNSNESPSPGYEDYEKARRAAISKLMDLNLNGPFPNSGERDNQYRNRSPSPRSSQYESSTSARREQSNFRGNGGDFSGEYGRDGKRHNQYMAQGNWLLTQRNVSNASTIRPKAEQSDDDFIKKICPEFGKKEGMSDSEFLEKIAPITIREIQEEYKRKKQLKWREQNRSCSITSTNDWPFRNQMKKPEQAGQPAQTAQKAPMAVTMEPCTSNSGSSAPQQTRQHVKSLENQTTPKKEELSDCGSDETLKERVPVQRQKWVQDSKGVYRPAQKSIPKENVPDQIPKPGDAKDHSAKETLAKSEDVKNSSQQKIVPDQVPKKPATKKDAFRPDVTKFEGNLSLQERIKKLRESKSIPNVVASSSAHESDPSMSTAKPRLEGDLDMD